MKEKNKNKKGFLDKIGRWLYNTATYFWYKVLGQPLKLKIRNDLRIGKPRLTVVFLHGIAATSSTWDVTLRQLARDKDLNNIRLIGVDLLGFGKALRADWLDYDYNEYEEALENTLGGVKTPIILVGHSMGSLIAAKYSSTHKEQLKRLILVSPPVMLPEELAKLPDKFYFKSYSSLHEWGKVSGVKVLAEFVEKVSSFRSRYLTEPSFERSMDNIVLNRENYQIFCRITTPTTIIHGRLDPLVIGANLIEVAKKNCENVKLIKVVSQHDICPRKRQKIKEILIKVLNGI